MQNTYDPEGLRSGIVENSISREFTFDRGSVISEYNASGNLMSRNIRGIGLVGLEDGIGRLDYYLQNAHGDVTEIVDANGGIQNQYSYDVFGNVLSSQEKLQNRFMYSGEQFDRITEQYYLRARYYEPETGRFTQEDTYRGDGLNLYTYVQNNPLRFVDPSGHATKCVVSPVWKTSDQDYSPAVQSLLLALNFDWYFANTLEEQKQIVKNAQNIRNKANDGIGWLIDKTSGILSAAADEFSWFLGGSPSANERDYWLEMNKWFKSDIQIKDNQTLRAGMFIAGILMPGPGGETNLFKNGVKSWIKHGTYNELKETLGKEGVEKFIKAARKGVVGAEGENGIKLITGKGIEEAGQFYKYELKVFGKGTSHYRILGNYDEKTGHIIFERIINK